MDTLPPTYRAVVIKGKSAAESHRSDSNVAVEFSPDFRKASAVATFPTWALLERLDNEPEGLLVKIHWTGSRASDRNDCSGRYGAFGGLPFVAGYEAVGRVLRVGSGVTRFRPGDAVGMILMRRGGASEYNVVPESECFSLPAALPDFTPFFNAGLTALCGLVLPKSGRMRCKADSALAKYFSENVDLSNPYVPEKVLITAAAGGVGLQAVQFALAAGNIVIALAGNDEKLDVLRSLGVQHAINYKAHGNPQQLADHIKSLVGEVDIVWETVGGAMLEALSEITAPKGRVVIIGQISLGYGAENDAKDRELNVNKPGAGAVMLRLLTGPNPHRDRAKEILKKKAAELTNFFLGTGKAKPADQFRDFVAAEVGLWQSGYLKGMTDNRLQLVGVSCQLVIS